MTDESEQGRARTAIMQAVRDIPRGFVASYGQVAALAGLPGRARLVGTVLRQSSAAEQLPWYRVVRADLTLAFPEGSEAFERQVERLTAEGVLVTGRRVAQRHRLGVDVLDAALWGP